jgi:RNA polymerase sigma factor (TIGR02999 family)
MTDPPDHSAGDVTQLLRRVREGDARAVDSLIPLIYSELHDLAERQMRRERADHTLSPTALVHEAYVRLADQAEIDWQGRRHFFGIAARVMRQVLVDHARRRLADKRGGDQRRTALTGKQIAAEARPEEVLELDQALEQLDGFSPRLRQVVEYRFFGGLTEPEIAELLGVSTRSIQRDWVRARAWLHQALDDDEQAPPGAGDAGPGPIGEGQGR